MEGGTATPAAAAAASNTRATGITINMTFLSSISCLFYVLEFLFGLICWSIIASVGGWGATYSFIMFVGVTSWLLTIFFLLLHIFGIAENFCSGIPWVIVELGHHGFWSLLYFINAIIIATYTHPNNGKMVTSTVFGFFNTVVHVAHTLVSLKKWRGAFPWESSSSS